MIPSQKKTGFTLIELLVVISIIALLLSIIVPSLAKAKDYAKRVVCSSNVRQCFLGLNIYASENNSKQPLLYYGPGVTFSGWPWDIPLNAVDAIIRSGGSRDTFYCPAYPEANCRLRWGDDGPNNSLPYRVVGYCLMLQVDPRNASDGRPPIAGTGNKKWVEKVTCKNPSATELVTDATLSQGVRSSSPKYYPDGKFTNLTDAYRSRTSHLVRGKDDRGDGGNMGFVDGHVLWRPFSEFERRWGYTALGPISGSTQITFWW